MGGKYPPAQYPNSSGYNQSQYGSNQDYRNRFSHSPNYNRSPSPRYHPPNQHYPQGYPQGILIPSHIRPHPLGPMEILDLGQVVLHMKGLLLLHQTTVGHKVLKLGFVPSQRKGDHQGFKLGWTRQNGDQPLVQSELSRHCEILEVSLPSHRNFSRDTNQWYSNQSRT